MSDRADRGHEDQRGEQREAASDAGAAAAASERDHSVALVVTNTSTSTAPNTIAERVVAHQAGLHLAQPAAGALERAADAVDRAVDHVAVDALAQEASRPR